MDVHIDWMTRRSMPQVLEIEQLCFEFPWPEDEFIHFARRRNTCCRAACYRGQVVGYMLYELHKNHLHVLNFAVHPAFWRRGVGRQLMEYKIDQAREHPSRRRILLEVRETNLDAQLFFRALGFRAISIIRDFYDDTAEDAFLFQYRVKQEAMV